MPHSATLFDESMVPSLEPIDNPGMITEEEEKLYFSLAQTHYDPDRIFLEIGTWLGRSTQRICQGLNSRAKDWKLYCFDQYKWGPLYKQRAFEWGKLGRRVDVVADLNPGDSFQEAFLTLMGDFRPKIEARQGRLGNIAASMSDLFQGTKNIGVLFIDAAKGWDENAILLKFIAPILHAGDNPSIILYQDFFYFPAFRLIFLLQMVPGLEPHIYTDRSSSIVYKVNDSINRQNHIFQEKSIYRLSESEIYEAWHRLCEKIPESRLQHRATTLSLPLMLWDCKFQRSAEREFANLVLDERNMIYIRAKLASNESLHIPPVLELMGLKRAAS